jgi:hypothetical protein
LRKKTETKQKRAKAKFEGIKKAFESAIVKKDTQTAKRNKNNLTLERTALGGFTVRYKVVPANHDERSNFERFIKIGLSTMRPVVFC